MTPIVKMFPSAERAEHAVRTLAENGVYADTVFLLRATPGEETAAVDAAVRSGRLRGAFAKACVDGLRRGRTIVSVDAPFGLGQTVIDILEDCGSVESELLPVVSPSQAAPFSTVLHWPVLMGSDSHAVLASSSSSTTLIDKAAPFSSMFGMKTLTSPKRDWKSSFGLPLLSDKAAPFSSMFGMKTLSASKSGSTSSFGLPLLMNKAAPFSGMFGLPVLTRRKPR